MLLSPSGAVLHAGENPTHAEAVSIYIKNP